MKKNIKIAHTYAKKQLQMLTEDGVWVSDNLPVLSRGERRAILKVYKKYFKTVDYNPVTGVCKCSNKDNTTVNLNGNWGINVDNAIKTETLDALLGETA
jgi:hypothetical protein